MIIDISKFHDKETDVFNVNEKCKSCGGTGLDSSTTVCKREWEAILCHVCNGSGYYEYSFNYIELIKRLPKIGKTGPILKRIGCQEGIEV